MIDFEKIKRAVEERNQFLAEHPELQSLQIEINEILNKIPLKDTHNRQVAIQGLMLNSWHRIIEAWEGKK